MNTGVECHALLQGIFLTQGSNLGLLRCRQILYHLSHLGNLMNNKNLFPTVLETVILRSGCQHGQFLVRSIFWVAEDILLIVSSQGREQREVVSFLVTLIRALIPHPIHEGLTLMTPIQS